MSSSIVDNSFALGAAIHYDFELAATPKPFEVLVEGLFGTSSPRGELRHWFIDGHNGAGPRLTYETISPLIDLSLVNWVDSPISQNRQRVLGW